MESDKKWVEVKMNSDMYRAYCNGNVVPKDKYKHNYFKETKKMNKLLSYIYKSKKFLVSERGAHIMLTCIIVKFLCGCGVNPFLAIVAGVLINHAGEVALRKPDIFDVMYGAIGAVTGAGLYFLANYIN